MTVPGWDTSTTVIPNPPVPGWESPPQPVYAFADATISVTASGGLVMHGTAEATVTPSAVGGLIGASLGAASLLGEGTVAFAAAAPTADASVSPTAAGVASIVADSGFPYTFPIVFGGSAVIATYSNADAVVSPVATADVELHIDALADLTILADATAAGDTTGGFPYEFDFTLGGVSGDLFPYVFDFELA